jgi:hypothetical protein
VLPSCWCRAMLQRRIAARPEAAAPSTYLADCPRSLVLRLARAMERAPLGTVQAQGERLAACGRPPAASAHGAQGHIGELARRMRLFWLLPRCQHQAIKSSKRASSEQDKRPRHRYTVLAAAEGRRANAAHDARLNNQDAVHRSVALSASAGPASANHTPFVNPPGRTKSMTRPRRLARPQGQRHYSLSLSAPALTVRPSSAAS